MRTSHRKTPPALRLRAARERRLASLYKRTALTGMYNSPTYYPTYYRYELGRLCSQYRKHYKGPYAHPDC